MKADKIYYFAIYYAVYYHLDTSEYRKNLLF